MPHDTTSPGAPTDPAGAVQNAIHLNPARLEAARQALGTKGPQDTVDAALEFAAAELERAVRRFFGRDDGMVRRGARAPRPAVKPARPAAAASASRRRRSDTARLDGIMHFRLFLEYQGADGEWDVRGGGSHGPVLAWERDGVRAAVDAALDLLGGVPEEAAEEAADASSALVRRGARADRRLMEWMQRVGTYCGCQVARFGALGLGDEENVAWVAGGDDGEGDHPTDLRAAIDEARERARDAD